MGGKSSKMQKNFSCDSDEKWACQACTYLNWPKTIRCVQCETTRDSQDVPTYHEPTGSCSSINKYRTPESINELAEKELERKFGSLKILDTSNQIARNFDGNTGRKNSPGNSPTLSTLYITEPSSSSIRTESALNKLPFDEDYEEAFREGTSISSLKNTLNTTNLLKNDKPSPLISHYDKSSLGKKQNVSDNGEVLLDSSTKFKTIPENYNLGGKQVNKFKGEKPLVQLRGGTPEYSSTYASKDSLQSLSNPSNKHLSSAGATRSSSLFSSSGCESNARNESICAPAKISSGSTSSNSNDKWACGVCTYDNWPRSIKCVMCLTPRINLDLVDPSHFRSKPSKAERTGVLNQNSESNLPSGYLPEDESGSLQSANNRISNIGSNIVGSSPVVSNNRRTLSIDARWLEACVGVVDGNITPVEQYLAAGGDPARQLSQFEVAVLNRPSAFDIGFTLIHLALRFHQEHVLAVLLSQVDNQPTVVKRVPSYVAPDLAMDIRRNAMASLRQRKGNFHCYYTSDIVTFIFPSEILDLRPDVQETLFNEILDRDVQKELESGEIINWSVELMGALNSRLYALWNRSAGDCLLDSVLQATWGIFDRDNGLRRALSDSLHECATLFYQRWKENELLHAHLLDFSLNDSQCANDWAKLLSLASKPGSSLEQLHIFALAHILRRPIIVYGVKYVKSFRGETLGFARYEGVYLPLLWDCAFCWKSPIALGYTRGHFSALVGLEPDCVAVPGASAPRQDDHMNRSIFLPLNSLDGSLLPIHFLAKAEMGKEEMILSQWLDVRFIDSGVMVACQRIQKKPVLVGQMVDEWLNHYRSIGQIDSATYMHQPPATCYSSDDSDD